MTTYCEICEEELTSEEAEEGVCKKCKKSIDEDEEYEKDEEFNDPAVT